MLMFESVSAATCMIVAPSLSASIYISILEPVPSATSPSPSSPRRHRQRYDDNNQIIASSHFGLTISLSSSPTPHNILKTSLEPLSHPQKLQPSPPSWRRPLRTLDQPVRLRRRRHPTSSCSSSVTRLSVSTRAHEYKRVTRRSLSHILSIVAVHRLQSDHPSLPHLH